MCEIDGGPALAPETVRRLACDASIVIVSGDGERTSCKPVRKPPPSPPQPGARYVGATAAVGSPAAAPARSPTFTTCNTASKGGSNDHRNLLELCWHHHRLVHEGGWNVRVDDRGEVLAIRPNGNVLREPPTAQRRESAAHRHDNTRLRHRHRPDHLHPRCYGDKLDLDHIITGLLCIDHPELILGGMN